MLLAAGKQPGSVLLNITVPTFWPLIPLLRPKGGPRRDQPLSSIHLIELGRMTTGEPRPLDDAIQAFDSVWPLVLQDQPNSLQDLEHSLLQVSSADRPLERCSLLTLLLVLALQPQL
ncbi:GDNF family receptor alpha-4 [Pteropus alecto]|uniref:GDNF family receptor alpha-4 n=1 Tax=Pteropus alecto TaxID=9402 RepID=L5JX37_PTEAL|nr:GDNF family receptor alpha-4 [Pteropus alecto]